MKMTRRMLVGLAAFLLVATAQGSGAKPDQLDGVSVPFGRIPQNIEDNRIVHPKTQSAYQAQ